MTPFAPSRRALMAGAAACALAGRGARAQDALEEQGYAIGDMSLGAEDAPVQIVEYS